MGKETTELVKCANCGQYVVPVYRDNTEWVPLFLFPIYYFYHLYVKYLKKRRTCPVCADDVYTYGMH